jgi:hypothetical protein
MSSTTEARAKESADNAPPLDPAGWVSLAAGVLIILITFFTSYNHVDLFGYLHFKVNQQIGIPLLLAAVAALVGEVKLASDSRRADQRASVEEASTREREAGERMAEARAREREANEADRERYRASRRARIQARFLVAQCRFLLADTARNRLQLNEALALLLEEPRLL